MTKPPSDLDRNRLSSRLGRYARLTGGMASTVVKTAARAAMGRSLTDTALAKDLRALLGGLRGPVMKVGQFAAMIPEILPAEFAAELAQLQANAPPMGAAFVRRRMAAELGPDWQGRFASFDLAPAAAASLGQVHRARHKDGRGLACKLQYPNMEAAVTADLTQLGTVLMLQRTFESSVDTRAIQAEIGDRLREELDYLREAAHMRLFRIMLAQERDMHVPEVVDRLSTKRVLTMTWLEGKPVTSFHEAAQKDRDQIGAMLVRAWWVPLLRYGVVHGDPHLGNYTVRADGGLNLFDFGCVRILPPRFIEGVIALVNGLAAKDRDAARRALTLWGFGEVPSALDTIAPLFEAVYEPLIEDRVRPIMEGTGATDYLVKFAEEKRERLRAAGVMRPPGEFVFHQRALVGLGAVLIQLRAKLNFHRLFKELAEDFSRERLAARQAQALEAAGLEV